MAKAPKAAAQKVKRKRDGTEIPSFLNYTKSISPSEGLLFGLVDGKAVPVLVEERTVRGSIGNYSDGGPSTNGKPKDFANANIQRVDVASLPLEATRLLLRYSVVIQASAIEPAGCDDQIFRTKLEAFSKAFLTTDGFLELGCRYAWNVFNGRTLWRNRFAREKRVLVKVDVAGGSGKTEIEGQVVEGLFDFPGRAKLNPSMLELGAQIGKALSGETGPLFLEIEISGSLPPGTEVYPSQEFVDGKGRAKQGDKSKTLSTVTLADKRRQATMHSQKIGNALRCIDDWHHQADDVGVISVEPWGFSQGRLKTLRMKHRVEEDGVQARSVYDLLLDLDAVTATLAGGKADPEALYLMAVLVRGGVFSGKAEVAKPAGDGEQAPANDEAEVENADAA